MASRQFSWNALLLKAEPDYYGRDYGSPVVYTFSNGRSFRTRRNIDPDLYWTADTTKVTADDTYFTADLTGPV